MLNNLLDFIHVTILLSSIKRHGSQFQPKMFNTLVTEVLPTYVVQHIILTKNPGWENIRLEKNSFLAN